MIQRNHRIVADAQKQSIKNLNLRPVGLLRGLGSIVNRRNGRLEPGVDKGRSGGSTSPAR